MCFSAGASFTAGAVISTIGIATMKEAKKPSQRLFAAIPLIFGIQQLAEGCIWLTLQGSDNIVIQKISTFVFLFAADVLWPVIIPLAFLLMEENTKKRNVIKIVLIPATAVSLYYAFFLLFFKITPEILTCHIHYITAAPDSLMLPAFLAYLAVTITPMFVSSVRNAWILGMFMFVACVIAVIFYTLNVTSIWCFFAAIMSIIIFQMLRKMNEYKQVSAIPVSGLAG